MCQSEDIDIRKSENYVTYVGIYMQLKGKQRKKKRLREEAFDLGTEK